MLAVLAGCGTSRSSVTVSSLTFNYGDVALSTRVRRIVLTVTNSSKAEVTLSPTLDGGADFTLSSDVSCGATLQPASKCSVIVTFAPTTVGAQTSVLDLGMSNGGDNNRIPLSGNGVQLDAGQSIVTSTDNPLVALYTYTPAVSGDVSVEFGPDTSYGFQTSAQAATAGTPVAIFVAGMRGNSTYHMRATLAASGGGTTADDDHTFATKNFSADQLPTLSVTTNGTPQPGVEFMNPAVGPNHTFLEAYAVDLQGNVIWGYEYSDRLVYTIIDPFKMLPNGDFLMVIALGSDAVTDPEPPGQVIVLREVNLAGVPVKQITLDQINSALSAAGYSLTVADLHHDVEILPNGHWVVTGNTFKSFNGLPGTTGSTDVIGDVLIDIDTTGKPVWVWNEFDHMDVSRAPAGYPDWTHNNAVLYVPGDGNLLVSSRHQSWVMKIDYRDGAGTGNVIWRLGYQGDFTLTNGTQPRDWFFGQHQPAFVGPSTTGTFSLALMDNGYTRQLAPGTPCSGTSCYTTVPILSVDENAKTATILWRDTFDSSKFALWGGGTTALANGNLEFDLCAEGKGSEVDEVTVTATPQTVWTLKTTNQNLYRANRAPSLYPGVQW